MTRRSIPGARAAPIVDSSIFHRRRKETRVATVDEGLQSQVRNIEARYGRSIDDWTSLIKATGLTRHGEIVATLKRDHGLTHGAANRVALTSWAERPRRKASAPMNASWAGPVPG